MDDREAIAWLHRRVGFGLAPGQLDALVARGVDRVLDELVDPEGHGVPPAPDPWLGLDLGPFDPDGGGRYATLLVGAWLRAMATTPRPLEEWTRWFWHGHLVSTLRAVKRPELMVGQLQLFGRHGLGDLRSLLREITVDPAMLIYLDGTENRRGRINENYGRELLELFALGIGNYSEADVRAAAVALSGWIVDRANGTFRFYPRQHDDTPQVLLGRPGVHDVDTAIDAVVAHEACARHLTGALGRAVLGPDVDAGLLDRLADDFRAGGLQLRPLLRALLEAGLDGAGGPLVQAPVPWLLSAIRAVGVAPDAALAVTGAGLAPAGQLPLDPPNVAGWPSGSAWLTSSATVARFNMASALSELAPPDGPVARAAAGGDHRALADALGRPAGFGPTTVRALDEARRAGTAAAVTIALVAPEVVLA